MCFAHADFPATEALDPYGSVPIHSHASYTSTTKIIAGYGGVQMTALLEMREGWLKASRNDGPIPRDT